MLQGEYCLKWSNYPADVANIFLEVLHSEFMVDVTICADGHELHAHRIVLSACSPYLQEILSCTEETHPVVILSGISFDDIQAIIEFMYQGEINVGADRIKSVLNTAEELQIRGLIGVKTHFEEKNESVEEMKLVSEEIICEQSEVISEAEKIDDLNSHTSENVEKKPAADMKQEKGEMKDATILKKYDDKKRKCRRKSCKKDYSEESLSAALEELRAGRSLIGTASAYHIPRSTLYVRARSQGIQLSMCRQGHAGERVQAAVKAVTDGASLQKAAEQFKIPKTVLWRNVHKHLGTVSQAGRTKFKKTYDEEKRRAAVKALEQGDNLTRVSHKFQIPKTTLFREKTRLVEMGRLPWSCLKRRGPYLDGFKKTRLTEAVAACKDGKMSQALASVTYQVPKTTIWRRLQEGSKTHGYVGQHEEKEKKYNPAQCAGTLKIQVVKEEEQSEPQLQQRFTFNPVENPIPVALIQKSEFSEASLIILSTGNTEKMATEKGSQIIVERCVTEESEEPANMNSENVAALDNENNTTIENKNKAANKNKNNSTVESINVAAEDSENVETLECENIVEIVNSQDFTEENGNIATEDMT